MAAGHQTAATETLAAGRTEVKLGAVLLTARTAHRTARTNQGRLAARSCDAVHAQMALALAHSTTCTAPLTAVADGILAEWTAAAVGGAAVLSTGPAQVPTGCTVFCTADRAGCHATARTKEPVAATAQVRAAFAGQMAAGVDRDARRFFSAAVTA